MKQITTIMLAMILLMLIISSIHAGASEWRMAIETSDIPGGPWQGMVIGSSPSASDEFDSQDRVLPSGRLTCWGTYHSAADGWSGTQGFYDIDIRRPVQNEKTWSDICYWWKPGGELQMNVNIYPLQNLVPPSNYRFTLYLDQVPQGVTYNGPWSWNISPTGKTVIPGATFPTYASTTGLDSYRFHLTVVAPEPSSLTVLAGGLVGICGMMVRRRRS